jgi:hypothetical protein
MTTAAAAAATAPLTVGMHVDAWISRMDALSSTELYALIVAATVIVSFVLLGTHPVADLGVPAATASSCATPTKTFPGPEPRWHIFRWVNWVAMAAFTWSVAEFAYNATTYLKSDSSTQLFQFLVGWSVFLCYFFGFFGVSFVHDLNNAGEGVNEQAEQEQDSVR